MFRFNISQLALFLGKSPVTIRGWERKGLIRLPRLGMIRSLTTDDLLQAALDAYAIDRISQFRLDAVTVAVQALKLIEGENQ